MNTIALIHRVIPLLFSGSLCFAGDLSGTVKLAGNEIIDVELSTDLVPAVGDTADIFFKVPGSNQEIAVGTGSVSWIGSDTVKVKIESSTSTVARNQIVKIHSANPKKRKAGVPAIPPNLMPVQVQVPVTPGPSKIADSVARGNRSATEEKTPAEGKPKASKAGEEGGQPSKAESPAGETKTAKDYYNDGFARHKAGDKDAAIEAYTRAIEVDPSYAPAYYNRACVYLVKKNYDGLIKDTTKALELGHASQANLFSMRGTAWAGKANFDKALADHTAAIEIDPTHALAYNNRGNDYYRKGDMVRAMKDCDKSIELDPSSPLPWYNRGYIHYSLRKNSNAVADWQKALELQPGYAAELEPLIRKLSSR
jgi:hypothetical protein